MNKENVPKSCFVIAPIGEEKSDTRKRSDQVLKHIIVPAVEKCGFHATRADEISDPGIITEQVIQRILDDDLVIADLTDRNPNVYYELAIRHAVKKPVVQIIDSGEEIPFDLASTRTIKFNYHDLDSAAQTREAIIKQIQTVEEDPSKVDSPISMAVNVQSLRQSSNLLEHGLADIISMLNKLNTSITAIQYSLQFTTEAPSGATPGYLRGTLKKYSYNELLQEVFMDLLRKTPKKKYSFNELLEETLKMVEEEITKRQLTVE